MIYAKNADLRREIHLSKLSYCDIDSNSTEYDLIVTRRDDARIHVMRVELEREPIVRLLTREHLPPDTKDLAFVPFLHLRGREIVGRSHTRDGALTRKLAVMIDLIASGMSRKGNWAGYSYVEEMRGEALIQMLRNALKYEESRSDNPFSYLSMIAHNAFIRILKLEQAQGRIRDALLFAAGSKPSYGYQDRAS